MMTPKNLLKIVILSALTMSSFNVAYAKSECTKDCPKPVSPPVVTYTVNTYEDNQDFCGYDVDGHPQVCVNANVTQVDTTKITQTTPNAHTMKVNAETTSDLQYTSKISFGEGV